MAEATVKLGMDTRGFDKGAQQATTTIGDISAFAAAKFAAMQAIVGRAMDAASQLIEAGMKRLTEEVLNAKREAEGLAMLSKRLEGVYGSAEKASKGMREIAAVSERLSITTQDASSLGATLADAGVPAKQLASAVRVLADVSAGSGKTMESLGKIYADVYKRGALSAEEFNALTAAGIPIQQQLSKQLFGGFEGAGDQARKGKVSADEFVRALQRMSTVTRGSGNLSIYAGASGVVLDSFDGKLRKIGETLRGFLVSLVGLFVKVDDGANRAATPLERIKNALKPVADAVLQSLQAVRPFVDQVVARFRLLMDFLSQGPDLAEQIAGKLKEGVTSLGFLERLPGYAREFGKQISDTVGFLTTAFQKGILWEIAGLRLQAAFADAVNALAVGISKAIVQSTAAVTDFISPVLSTVSAAIGSAIEVLTDKQTFIQLGEYLISTFDLATNYLKDAMTRAVDAIKNLFLNEVVPSILGGFDYLVAKLKSKAGLTGGNASLGAYIFANKAPIQKQDEGPTMAEKARSALAAAVEQVSSVAPGIAKKIMDSIAEAGSLPGKAWDAISKTAAGSGPMDADGIRAKLNKLTEEAAASVRATELKIPDALAAASVKLSAPDQTNPDGIFTREKPLATTIASSLARIGGGGRVSVSPLVDQQKQMVEQQKRGNEYLQRLLQRQQGRVADQPASRDSGAKLGM